MATASNQITYVFSAVNNLTATTERVQKDMSRLTKQFTKLSGAVQNAFQFYVRYRIFSLISRGISALEDAIPSLISRGQEWANTVDDIADSSGLAADQSSLLAGMVQTLTGNVEGLTKALGALSANAVNHSDVLKRYGIDTKDANGRLLDSWTILKNVRKALSDVGNGFITTAAARELFSRGGQTLIDFLTMSDKQFRFLTRDIKESGVIMGEAGRKAGEEWQRTQQRFEMTITGIGSQIVQRVQPLLSSLVDGITNYLRKNMASIVGWVTGVISFVAGAIAGFLGIDLATKTWAKSFDDLAKGNEKRNRDLSKSAETREQQTESEDGYTKALNRQVEAIDRQLAAMDKSEDAEDARREHASLLKDISEARKQLSQLRGESIFAAGMSAAEAELARQAQAADIVDAQKAVRDAQQKLAEQERDQARDLRRTELTERKEMLQQRLADHIKMLADEAAADREALGQIFDPKGGIGGFSANIAEVIAEGKKGLLKADVGEAWGKQFRGTLEQFFDNFNDPTTGLGKVFSGLANVAQAVIDNWDKVALIGAGIIALNLASSFSGLALALTGPIGLTAAVLAAAAALGILAMNTETAQNQGMLEEQAAVVRSNPNADLYADFWQGLANSGVPLDFFGVHNQNVRGGSASGGGGGGATRALQGLDNKLTTINASLGKNGPLADVATSVQQTSARLAREGTIAQGITRIASNTATLSTSQPWGIANIQLIVDRKTILQVLGVPVGGSNSTTKQVQ